MINFIRVKSNVLKSIATVFLIISVLLIYLAPFFVFDQSSKQAALVRVFLFISSVFFISVSFKEIKSGCFKKISFFYCSIFLLFCYLILNSLFLSIDFKPVRRLFLIMTLFIPFFYININEEKTRKILVLTVSIISFLAAFSLFAHYVGGTLPQGYRHGGLIDSGVLGVASFGNTIISGMHYAIAFSIATYLYFTEVNRFLLFVWGMVKIILVTYIALTFARTAWVAVLVSFGVIFFMTFDKRKIRFYLPMVILISVFLYFSLNYLDYEIGERGLSSREEAWKATILEMPGYWFFGHGLLNAIGWITIQDGAHRLNNSHSLYLEILYQVGIVGLILHLCCIISAIYVLFKSYLLGVYGSLSVLLTAILLSISVVMTVDIIGWINSPGLVWMWLWCPLAMSIVFERKLCQIKS